MSSPLPIQRGLGPLHQDRHALAAADAGRRDAELLVVEVQLARHRVAKLGDFIAFNAAMSLLEENNMEHVIDEVYHLCVEQLDKPKEEIINHVKKIYEPFTEQQVSAKISQLLKPADVLSEVEIIYQSVDDLHKSIPNHLGDWYFTGNYPTPGGNKVACRAFVNFMKGANERAY